MAMEKRLRKKRKRNQLVIGGCMGAVDNSELPGDLVIEILLRLPVKSIMRFNCVAKNWSHLFKTPSFVSQHSCLSKEMNRKNMIHDVIIRCNDFFEKECKYQMLRFGNDGKTLVSRQDFHQRLLHHVSGFGNGGRPDYSMTVGDGLICFSGVEGMTLWNPATQKFRILPDFNQYIPNTLAGGYKPKDIVQGGIDASSNDYKVLVIRKYYKRAYKDQYAIYRMSSDSWRVFKEEELELINDQLYGIRPNKWWSVCVNGVFYWKTYTSKLLAFHLDTEVFETLPLPGKQGELMALHDGRLSFWEWRRPDSNAGGVVWVMNDDQGNWTKLFNININAPSEVSVNRRYGFWTHGKVFVEVDSDTEDDPDQLHLYDIETGELCDLGMEGYPRVFIYQESLLAVGPSP